ncbi:helicase-related protein, partial [Streptomyces sp.]|uniref:helicase-related protein n=1 Tax=Streptomyces sp. TaxID=1931 RepID=UPI002D2B3195
TNVAARGIHVDHLDLVVNVDPPTDHKDYLHRGGRTARAGESGSVVTLVTPNQRRGMTRLMAAAGIVPQTTQIRTGEEALHRITGAQTPTGIPVVITTPIDERPKKRGTTSRGRRRPAAARRAPLQQSTTSTPA